MYYPLTVPVGQRQHKLRIARAVLPELRTFLSAQRRGWVKVVPYSQQLLFLCGRQGEYAWVAKNLRSEPPPTPKGDIELQPVDLPQSFQRSFDFQRWLYFREAWGERDEHEAEESYYSAGGSMEFYPAWPAIERQLHAQRGEYHALDLHRDEPAAGFQKQRFSDGSELYVSELVTIREYDAFLSESDYGTRRFLERGYNDLELANQLDAKELPVACSYYDAIAYAAWMERKLQRPVRLLRTDEYLNLHPKSWGGRLIEERPRCVEFDFAEYRAHHGAGFEYEPRARFREPLPFRHTRGLRFVDAFDFGEWLFEYTDRDAAAICAYDLTGLHDHLPVQRDFFPAKSWGKYRQAKIGFRLCYMAVPRSGGASR